MEISRSFARKINLVEYGYPYETIDLFAAYKMEVVDKDASPKKIEKVSKKLEKLAVGDVERQEKEVRAYFKIHKRDLDTVRQAGGKKKHQKKSEATKHVEKVQEKMREEPTKTAGEASEEVKAPF